MLLRNYNEVFTTFVSKIIKIESTQREFPSVSVFLHAFSTCKFSKVSG